MSILVAAVLDADQVQGMSADLRQLDWRDGAKTAGRTARAVKRNQQADTTTKAGRALHDSLNDCITRHPVFQAAARPARMSRLLLSRTGPGGGYGAHIDNALMGQGATRMRTDLSFTLFLSDPDSYGGGELRIEQSGGTHSFKPAAGDLVLYPTTAIHEVAEVTSGERLACVGWVQSLIRSEAERAILFDLENLRAALAERVDGSAQERLVLDKTISNLLRLWAEI